MGHDPDVADAVECDACLFLGRHGYHL
jgi:hypothetical protein